MRISIIGTGYVGLVTGACLSLMGLDVACMDSDEQKINRLRMGEIPIYEPGLPQLLSSCLDAKRLHFTSSMEEAVQHGEILFIAVNTPTMENWLPDLTHVLQAARDIAAHMDGYRIIVNKSTVPIGAGKRVKREIQEELSASGKELSFDVVSNPEFLREGTAITDFLRPDRIVIGCDSEKAAARVREIYRFQELMGVPLLVTGTETAEMIKYASNTFLAVKLSFINEMANLCEGCGADIQDVARGMGLDPRIGSAFLKPGPGYGGSCLPKDTKALVGMGETLGYVPKVVKAAIQVNSRQPDRMMRKIRKAAGGLKGRTISILGLSFKADTDDIRESPSLELIRRLLKKQAVIRAYDPNAAPNAAFHYPELPVRYCCNPYDACTGADCIVVATEWPEFSYLDFDRLKALVHKPSLVDLRNLFAPDVIWQSGFTYQGVGRS